MTPPLHQFRPEGKWGMCAFTLKNGKRCQRQAQSAVHRYYPCRAEGCTKDDLRSIEARDRHEANIHGQGW